MFLCRNSSSITLTICQVSNKKTIIYKTIISPVVRCCLRDDISREWRILHNELCGSHMMPRIIRMDWAWRSDGGDKKHRIVVRRLLQYLVGGWRVVWKSISGKLVVM
jgi:hypothetical protein